MNGAERAMSEVGAAIMAACGRRKMRVPGGQSESMFAEVLFSVLERRSSGQVLVARRVAVGREPEPFLEMIELTQTVPSLPWSERYHQVIGVVEPRVGVEV